MLQTGERLVASALVTNVVSPVFSPSLVGWSRGTVGIRLSFDLRVISELCTLILENRGSKGTFSNDFNP